MEARNLWGDLEVETPVGTPVDILREQGSQLADLTNDVLSARIRTTRTRDGALETRFDVIAPLLDNYFYTLLSVRHGVCGYPLVLSDYVNEDEVECTDEDQFIDELGRVLSSDGVKKVVQFLVSQSRSVNAA